MYRTITVRSATRPPAKAVCTFLFPATRHCPIGLAELDRSLGGALKQALSRPEFTAERGDLAAHYPATGAERLWLAGLGPAARFTPECLRVAVVRALKAAFAARVTHLQFVVLAALEGSPAEGLEVDVVGRALGDALAIGNHVFDRFKSPVRAGKADPPLDLTVEVESALLPHVRRGLDIGLSVTLARTLAATPPNIANPDYLVATARQVAREAGLVCRVVDAAQARKLGMGGLLAVGGAGSAAPAVICLEWKPRNTGRKPRAPKPRPTVPGNTGPVMLVGKAVTFDTGGFSLKPADSMLRMKYDKCGGVAVLAAMQAVARLKLPQHVVGVIPTVENMIASTAYRPDDILTHCNGVTVEVTNTDAEGRLILADALAYGCRTYRPRAVIDLATLTGGCVVALGPWCAGMFANTPAWRDAVAAAGDFTGERVWPLPLWPEHREHMKGAHSQIVNSAGREGSPLQGAAYLSYFCTSDGQAPAFDEAGAQTNSVPWVHLDIAGVADVNKDTPLFAKGPTGWGVRLLVRLLEGLGA